MSPDRSIGGVACRRFLRLENKVVRKRGIAGALMLAVAVATPAMAAMNSSVGFTYSNLNLQYDQLAGRTIQIHDSDASRAVIQAIDGGSPGTDLPENCLDPRRFG